MGHALRQSIGNCEREIQKKSGSYVGCDLHYIFL